MTETSNWLSSRAHSSAIPGFARWYVQFDANQRDRPRLVFMRRIVSAATTLLMLMIIIAAFIGGQFAERQAQRHSSLRSNSSDQASIANVASASFGESWGIMRRASREQRSAWGRELEQLPPGTRRNAAIESFYKIWIELDPTQAVRGVETIRDKRLQALAFRAVADAAADSALSAVAQLEFRLGYRPTEFGPSSVLGRWATADPEAVAHFLETHPNRGSARFFDVAYSWAHTEPQKAGEWVTSLKLPPLHDPQFPRMHDRRRLDATRGLLLAWLENDRRDAAAFAATHATDPDVKEALGELAQALFIKSREEMTTFIQSLPDEAAQRAALSALLEDVSGVIRISDGGDEEEPEDPEIACKEIALWLVTLPAKLWMDHVGEIFECWEAAEPSRAEEWLRALPADVRSKAIADYCTSASAEKAARLLGLLALINDTGLRIDLLQKFVDKLGHDPSEAREKIAALPLSQEQKQMLINRVRDRR